MGGWKSINLVGKRFGRLVVKSRAPNGKHWRVFWNCDCDCGRKAVVRGDQLKSGTSKSCGCLKIELWNKKLSGNKNNFVHGLHKHPLYKVWGSMKTRCYNPKAKNYPDYGGRGIKVCDKWLHSFESFLNDVGERPEGRGKLSLDRKNVNGDYEPDNVKWSTYSEQRKNTRKMRVLQAQLDSEKAENQRLRSIIEKSGIKV